MIQAVLERLVRGEDIPGDQMRAVFSNLTAGELSDAEIAAVLGHKTLAMVQRYAHLSEPHTSKVVESMNERIFRKGLKNERNTR